MAARVRRQPALAKFLADSRHRLLSFELLEPPRKQARPQPANAFRATYFDYTNNRTIRASGPLADLGAVRASESGEQPLPSDDEFAEAAAIVSDDPDLGAAIREQLLVPYRVHTPTSGYGSDSGRFSPGTTCLRIAVSQTA